MRVRLAVVVLALCLVGHPALAQPSAPTGLQVYSGTFNGSDTFSAPLNTTNWAILDREGDLSNTELECYRPANQSVAAGLLNLTAKQQSVTCNGHAYSYTSSMVQWKSFNFTYGTIEVRAKMPGGTGPWPAIWLLGVNCQQSNQVSADNSGACVWPQPGSDEIDITEFLANSKTTVNQQIHSSSNNAGCSPTTADASQNYHVYRFEWAKNSATWKIDGVQTCHLTTAIPSTPMFLMLNVAMHGAVGGLPQTMSVDYVTVTQP
jgi:beta-glucanase (GH16 family)